MASNIKWWCSAAVWTFNYVTNDKVWVYSKLLENPKYFKKEIKHPKYFRKEIKLFDVFPQPLTNLMNSENFHFAFTQVQCISLRCTIYPITPRRSKPTTVFMLHSTTWYAYDHSYIVFVFFVIYHSLLEIKHVNFVSSLLKLLQILGKLGP